MSSKGILKGHQLGAFYQEEMKRKKKIELKKKRLSLESRNINLGFIRNLAELRSISDRINQVHVFKLKEMDKKKQRRTWKAAKNFEEALSFEAPTEKS